MAPEGELRLGLVVAQGRIQRLAVSSTRPDVAHRLLRGRSVAEVQAAVPRLFSLCSRSQAAACRLALAASHDQASPALLQQARRAVALEMLRETAWLVLLQWPRQMGEAPSPQAVAAARLAAGTAAVAPDARAIGEGAADAVAQALWGMSAAQWLALADAPALHAWAAAGGSACARFVQRASEAAATGSDTPAPVALLPAEPDTAAMQQLAWQLTERADFAALPLWQGAPAETGALARQQAEPLPAALLARGAGRRQARAVARLRELAGLLCGDEAPACGALALGPGAGLAWVNNARGLLVHHVRRSDDGQRVTGYDIVAPTEWNFHPQGALSSGLLGNPVRDWTQAREEATRLIHSLDPCVACRVEIDHA